MATLISNTKFNYNSKFTLLYKFPYRSKYSVGFSAFGEGEGEKPVMVSMLTVVTWSDKPPL